MYKFYTGYILGNLPLEKSGIISKEHVCEGECSKQGMECVNFYGLCVQLKVVHEWDDTMHALMLSVCQAKH